MFTVQRRTARRQKLYHTNIGLSASFKNDDTNFSRSAGDDDQLVADGGDRRLFNGADFSRKRPRWVFIGIYST